MDEAQHKLAKIIGESDRLIEVASKQNLKTRLEEQGVDVDQLQRLTQDIESKLTPVQRAEVTRLDDEMERDLQHAITQATEAAGLAPKAPPSARRLRVKV